MAITSRAAATACVSEIGFEFTFQIDSSECESASRPAASVGPAGSETVSSGSTTAASGQVSFRCSEYFFITPGVRSQTVAHGVTSLPVPAVVGTAMSGFTRAGVNGLPVARSCTRSENLPLGVPTIRALAVSSALPPPMPEHHVGVAMLAPEALVHAGEARDVGIGDGVGLDRDQRARRGACARGR